MLVGMSDQSLTDSGKGVDSASPWLPPQPVTMTKPGNTAVRLSHIFFDASIFLTPLY
jgi:hypothetical protein